MELDPTQFLAQDSSDEDDDEQIHSESTTNGTNPSILTSLGLQHVNTPYGSLAVRLQTTRETLLNNFLFTFNTCLYNFRILTILLVKFLVTMESKVDKHQRTVQFAIYNFQIEQMLVDMRRIDIISMRQL
jgi:hypothetical protein